MNQRLSTLSNEEYHSNTAIGSTDLGLIHKSVAEYEHAKFFGKKDTDAFTFGRFFHTLILEPEKVQQEYACAPKKVLKKDVGAVKYEEYKRELAELELSTKTIISDDMAMMGEAMAANMLTSDLLRAMLEKGRIEESYFWTDEKTGIKCKCRPDIYVEELGIVIDLKSTKDAAYNEWRRTLVQRSYDRQAAHYMNGIEAVTGKRPSAFVFAVAEKKAPYDFAFYQIDEASLEVGAKLAEMDLKKYKNALENPEKKTLPKDIQLISLSAFGFDIENR